MHRISVALTLCLSFLGGCTANSPPEQAPAKEAAPPATPPVTPPVPPPTSTPSAPLAVWHLELTTQFLGTVAGPEQVVVIDAGGAVKVTVDGKLVGEATLPATQLEPLARLLAAPALAAAKTNESDIGPQTHLVVTGDVEIDVRGQLPELTPIAREVDRLRDLVAPPEGFKVVAIDGPLEVLVSSNGYVEVKRDGVQVATHFLPVGALAQLRTLLAAPALRSPEAWVAPAGTAKTAELRIDGDIVVGGALDRGVASPGSAVLAEALRLGDIVAAKTRPMLDFEAVLTSQLHGAGLGPLRSFTVRSRDRHLSLVDKTPDAEQSERPLTEAELASVAAMLVDPDFRTAESPRPSGEGMVYRVKITGDQPMEATYRGAPPQPVIVVFNRLDWLARHF